MKYNKDDKKAIGLKIMDLGTFSIITLTFGSMMSGKFLWWTFFIGILLFLFCWIIGLKLVLRR